MLLTMSYNSCIFSVIHMHNQFAVYKLPSIFLQMSCGVTVQYPATIMYMCRCALKSEVDNNSCYSYSNKW